MRLAGMLIEAADAKVDTRCRPIEFFRLFPDADEFKLSTAVRMNASFPCVSPVDGPSSGVDQRPG
jgi:hypothetical protein